ncbi:succinate-semialdehyde dehydrogenase [Meredithblackwellia eburnea MCA 4105]
MVQIDVPALLARLSLTRSSCETPLPGLYDGVWGGTGPIVTSVNPATGETLARVQTATVEETNSAIVKAKEAQREWRKVPAPTRGSVLREIRDELVSHIDDLGALISLEMGKILSEGKGEVQEFVDILDLAIGLSRSYGGNIVQSERPNHFITEVHNPLGLVGIISAFNFPCAVYGWNASLALVTGNSTIWKPSPTTLLVSLATTTLVSQVLERNGHDGALASLVCGAGEIGKVVVESNKVELVSFTGSEETGRTVARTVAGRFGKSILELGGNNAAIVLPDANLSLALPSIVFAALGTAGQRCTTTRRLFLHRSICKTFLHSLVTAYKSTISTRIGDPLAEGTLVGPLHSTDAVERFERAVAEAREQGGQVLVGGDRVVWSESAGAAGGGRELEGGNWVQPTIVYFEDAGKAPVMQRETFAPILYVVPFDTLEEAIELNNSVPQGLSSALFTQNFSSAFKWIGPEGSDCGIVNVNGSTSGAEISAAFGGNKSTGWGRESGGDAWKAYCRQASCTLNWSNEIALAQGVVFD